MSFLLQANPATPVVERRPAEGTLAALAIARFSVVIPLYNKAPHIAATLRSALSDNERVLEVIVIDDGSTDGSADIVRRETDPRVRLISQPNGGVSRARNRGIEAARGEWVAFLDADDLWQPGYIERLDALATRFPDCAMVATSYVVVDETGGRQPPDGRWDLPDDSDIRVDDFFELMSHGHICCTISTAVKRSLLIKHDIRFPEGESLGEDLDFFLRAAEHTALALSPRPLALYIDSRQVSRLSHQFQPLLVPPYLARLEQRWRSGQVPPERAAGIPRYLATKYECSLAAAAHEGRRLQALKLLLHPLLLARWTRWPALLALLLLPASWVTTLRRWREVLDGWRLQLPRLAVLASLLLAG